MVAGLLGVEIEGVVVEKSLRQEADQHPRRRRGVASVYARRGFVAMAVVGASGLVDFSETVQGGLPSPLGTPRARRRAHGSVCTGLYGRGGVGEGEEGFTWSREVEVTVDCEEARVGFLWA